MNTMGIHPQDFDTDGNRSFVPQGFESGLEDVRKLIELKKIADIHEQNGEYRSAYFIHLGIFEKNPSDSQAAMHMERLTKKLKEDGRKTRSQEKWLVWIGVIVVVTASILIAIARQ